MDPRWLLRNISEDLKHGCSLKDTIASLRWKYSSSHPWLGWGAALRVIQLKYAPPIGLLRAAVRCNGGSDNFIFSEVFHHLYYNLPLEAAPRTILDLGANAGFTAMFFSRMYPAAEIACVEPIPENLECLKLNLKLNEVAARVFEAAIAPNDGMVSMELDAMDYGHHVSTESTTDGRPGTQRVPAISIPTCMNAMNWQRINLLKMDIEGYETVLLAENCEWLRLVDAICIEWHGDHPRESLHKLAQEWDFLEPERLPGNWLLRRAKASV